MYKSIDSTRIRNLKVVAMIKQGERLRTRAHHYSIDSYTSMFSYKPIYRYLTGEGKEETVDSVSKLVESCVKQSGLSVRDKGRLVEQLKDVIRGLDNLSVTYKEDSTSCAGLNYIQEMIEDFIVSEDSSYVRQTAHHHGGGDGDGGGDEVDLDSEDVSSEP
jgi:hypothetical protein